jgi:uncharacterized protein (UPF0210 family)
MLGIRSVTCHLPQGFTIEHISRLNEFVQNWKRAYTPIRTFRINLPTIDSSLDDTWVKHISTACNNIGARWFNVPINPHLEDNWERNKIFHHAFSILRDFPHAFVNIIAVKNNEIDYDILNRSAKLIQNVSTISNNGYDNFRLGISNNVQPDGPFFPFTMSSGDYGFSIALELTQAINDILNTNKEICNLTLSSMRKCIIDALRPKIDIINDLAEKIAIEHKIIFKGFDFSLAPIIDNNGSVFSILKAIGLKHFGNSGTMFATAFLTQLLKSFGNSYKMLGFSGVMYSLLEDLEFCSMNINKGISIEHIVSVSTMCGCGVDMVPIYGEATIDEIFSIFLDIAAISCRLNKPLGIRLLPIPRTLNKKDQYTTLSDDADFITNTKIVEINNTFNPYLYRNKKIIL